MNDANDVAARLENYTLFKGVPPADREALINVMQRKHFDAGTVLFERGDPGDSMYVILQGKVRIYTQDADGNDFTVRYLDEMFGEFAMLDNRPRSAAVAAVEPLDVLVLHRDDFIAFLRERPVVGLAMMRNLVERVRYTTMYLQHVMDATRQLAEGNYRFADVAPDSDVNDEIQELVSAFVRMVQGVQMREEALKRAQSDQPNVPDEPVPGA